VSRAPSIEGLAAELRRRDVPWGFVRHARARRRLVTALSSAKRPGRSENGGSHAMTDTNGIASVDPARGARDRLRVG
jgi:hypothetical protein